MAAARRAGAAARSLSSSSYAGRRGLPAGPPPKRLLRRRLTGPPQPSFAGRRRSLSPGPPRVRAFLLICSRRASRRKCRGLKPERRRLSRHKRVGGQDGNRIPWRRSGGYASDCAVIIPGVHTHVRQQGTQRRLPVLWLLGRDPPPTVQCIPDLRATTPRSLMLDGR